MNDIKNAPLWVRSLIRVMKLDPKTVSLEIATPVRQIDDPELFGYMAIEHTGDVIITVTGKRRKS